jgi:hypothetical protein
VRDLILECLESRPSMRPSALQIAERLQALPAQGPPPTPPPSKALQPAAEAPHEGGASGSGGARPGAAPAARGGGPGGEPGRASGEALTSPRLPSSSSESPTAVTPGNVDAHSSDEPSTPPAS